MRIQGSRFKKSVVLQRQPNEVPVMPGLAMTPADMMLLAKQGIPISAQRVAEEVFEGHLNPDWNVMPEHVRGIDMNDLWNADKSAKKKFRKAHERDVATYGETPKTE